mmetsp:Transcript_7454/g.11129  ORF Transcript_7454/g.11129 Transcript_7454/m.11129 type:complete len:88 (-) Transcript_7454:36-299(-)
MRYREDNVFQAIVQGWGNRQHAGSLHWSSDIRQAQNKACSNIFVIASRKQIEFDEYCIEDASVRNRYQAVVVLYTQKEDGRVSDIEL